MMREIRERKKLRCMTGTPGFLFTELWGHTEGGIGIGDGQRNILGSAMLKMRVISLKKDNQ